MIQVIQGYYRIRIKFNQHSDSRPTPIKMDTVNFTEIETSFSTSDSVKNISSARTSFSHDTHTFVVDNCANVHIVNDKELFHSFKDAEVHTMATIGGRDLKPDKVGIAMLRIKDDKKDDITLQLDNVFYFPDSQVNIISIVI